MGLYDRDYMRKERKEDDPRIEFSKLPSSLEQRLESLKASLRVIKSQQSMSSKVSNSFVYWLMILALLFLWLFFMFFIFS
jgi:ATP-dependent Zn protease